MGFLPILQDFVSYRGRCPKKTWEKRFRSYSDGRIFTLYMPMVTRVSRNWFSKILDTKFQTDRPINQIPAALLDAKDVVPWTSGGLAHEKNSILVFSH